MKQGSAKYKRAVALRYSGLGSEAPAVCAKGDFCLADEIVRLAQRYNIPIVDRPELARALNSLPLDREIPPELYESVALLIDEIERFESSKIKP